MKLLKLLSKAMHLAIICCFCMPFLKGCSGCELSNEEKNAIVKNTLDSISYFETDTIKNSRARENDSLKIATAIQLQQTPADYSGFDVLVIGCQYGAPELSISIVPFVLLLLFTFCISFRKKPTYKWVFILSLFELLFLFIFFMLHPFDRILYGYWITYFLSFVHSVVAYLIWRKHKMMIHNT
jgi:hypothetical protein